jgi:tellurite methyltransferase
MDSPNFKSRSEIKRYWNEYYVTSKEFTPPSLFALNIVESLIGRERIRLMDYGCGNGRDSFFFSKHFEVLGVDISEVVIKENAAKAKEFGSLVRFEACNTSQELDVLLRSFKPDIFYARFLLHAIDLESENVLLSSLAIGLKQGASVYFECRTTEDPLIQKGTRISQNEAVHGHYRRFIVPEELHLKLSNLGFQINLFITGNDFSPTQEDNPNLLRVIATKVG